jgi:uncharacterized membrane protein
MGGFLRFALAALVIAALVHGVAVFAAPTVIMAKAMDRVSRQGAVVNAFAFGGRVTPQSRAIVRPSPDLAYATCAYDLSSGPVHIRLAPWDDYYSLSLYAANTDNFFTMNDRSGAPIDIVLVANGQAAPAGTAKVVTSPSAKGIALERRLAPTADRFALADVARQADVCEVVK